VWPSFLSFGSGTNSENMTFATLLGTSQRRQFSGADADPQIRSTVIQLEIITSTRITPCGGCKVKAAEEAKAKAPPLRRSPHCRSLRVSDGGSVAISPNTRRMLKTLLPTPSQTSVTATGTASSAAPAIANRSLQRVPCFLRRVHRN